MSPVVRYERMAHLGFIPVLNSPPALKGVLQKNFESLENACSKTSCLCIPRPTCLQHYTHRLYLLLQVLNTYYCKSFSAYEYNAYAKIKAFFFFFSFIFMYVLLNKKGYLC